jgi:co-chaperonin GroES (HSP10)
MEIIPMHDYAIVQEVGSTATSDSSSQLVVPDNIKNDYFLLAKIVTVGPGFSNEKNKDAVTATAGDTIICNKLTALPLKMVGSKTFLINAESIFGIVKG